MWSEKNGGKVTAARATVPIKIKTATPTASHHLPFRIMAGIVPARRAIHKLPMKLAHPLHYFWHGGLTVNANDRLVKGPDGLYGTIDITCWPNLDEQPEPEVDMRLPDGQHVTLPADALIEQKDGSYYLPWHDHELNALRHRKKPEQGTDGCWPCPDDHEKELSPAQD